MFWVLFYISLPIILFIAILVVKELIAIHRTKFYTAQGFGYRYIPFIGVYGTQKCTEARPNDGVSVLKDLVQDAQDKGLPGVVFNHQLGHSALVVLTDLKLIREFFLKEIEVSHRKSVLNPPMYMPFFWDNSEEALYKRTIFAEFFRTENLKRAIDQITVVSQKFIGELKEKIRNSPNKEIEIDMRAEMVKWTSAIAEETLFVKESQKLTEHGRTVCQALYLALQGINSMNGGLSLPNLLTYGLAGRLGLIPVFKDGINYYKEAEKVIFEVYRERSKAPDSALSTSILDLMVKHNRTNPKYLLTERDAVGYMMIFIFAGVDTSSKFMQNSMYCLAKNTEVQKKIREDVKEFNMVGPHATIELLDKSETLNGMYKEVLRMYTPAPSDFERKLLKDFTLGPYHFRKGDFISIQLVGSMNTTNCTEDPNTFDASRYAKNAPTNKKVNTQSYMPFSLGKRNCVGQLLAEILFKVSVTNIVNELVAELPAGDNNHIWDSNPLYSIDHLKVKLSQC